MNFELFLVRKIALGNRKSFSSFIIRIAIGAVALSVATMIIATSMVNGFQKEIRNKVTGFWSHLQIQPYSLSNYLLSEPVYLYQDFYKNKALIPEARHIQVTALKAGILKTNDEFEGVVLRGAGPDFDWKNFEPYLKEGNPIRFGTEDALQDILVSRITANRLHLKINDKVLINFKQKQKGVQSRDFVTRKFYVRGIYETGLEEFDRRYVLSNIGIIQDLNNWGSDTVGGFEIFLEGDQLFKSRSRAYLQTMFGSLLSPEQYLELNKDPLDKIGESIYARLTNTELDVTTIKALNPGVFDWLNIQTMNELIILSLMIVVAVINMITTLIILILERANMIGIMKAMGAANVSIRKMFIYYSAVIIFTGLLLGNFFGIGLCLLQQHFHLIKLPQESYYLSYAPVLLNWGWILSLNLFTILITLLLLLIPSGLVSSISPLKAIRFD